MSDDEANLIIALVLTIHGLDAPATQIARAVIDAKLMLESAKQIPYRD